MSVDGVTGLPLFVSGEQGLRDALREAADAGEPAAMTVFQLDTEALDASTLLDVARAAQLTFAGDGVVFRRDDESFCAVSFGASERGARARADELRRRMRSKQRSVTCGVSVTPVHGTSVRELSRGADDAVVRGRRAGGDRVVLARRGGDS